MHHRCVQAEPVLSRDEVVGMLFNIADMTEDLGRIRELLEGAIGGEEALPEDDG